MKVDKNGFVELKGSEGWRSGYDFGEEIEKVFPCQEGYDFALAVEHNDSPPMEEHQFITGLVCLQVGQNDGQDWIWQVVFEDDSSWIAQGGCDYTGWDCQSSLSWEIDDSEASIAEATRALVKIRRDLSQNR